MSPQITEATAAQAFAENETVAGAIDSIIAELRAAQSSMTGARGPTAELAESYQQYLDRQAAVKGRGAYYPYIGSGLGNGPLVELADGSVKWDMINGIGVHMFGHSDPDLARTALRAALGDTVMQGNLQYNAEAVEMGELLVTEASRGSDLKHCFLINTGAMANESALKVCFQKHAPASRILAFADCFMGRSTTMAQIGDSAAGRVGVPLNVHVDYMPFFDPEQPESSTDYAVKRLSRQLERYPGQHACFVFELIQGEGGFNVAPREFFAPLMELCKEHGVAVWIDEIQTFGRTNEMFHFQELDLGQYVDVVTIGKMSQVCACLFTEHYNPKPGLLSATFIGSTIGLQVGAQMLRRLRDGGYYGPDGRIAQLHAAFRQRMAALVDRHPQWFPAVPHPSGASRVASGVFGGTGGMMRLTPFAGAKDPIVRACNVLFEEGVVAFYCGHEPFHIRFLPPVGVMEPQQFDSVFEILERTLERVADEN